MADTKISDLSAGGNVLSTDKFVVARSGTDVAVLGKAVSVVELIYRYTVVGSDKASIDTGADTPDAGSNDWTSGDLLELYLYSRTDEAVLTSIVYLKFNNSSTNIYDRQFVVGNNVTTNSSPNIGTAGVEWNVDGASQAANYFSHSSAYVPNFTGTVGYKAIGSQSGTAASAAANGQVFNGSHVYRDTAAITRAAISIATAGKKFKVGTQFLIYKRRSL